jgi:hypothetical protein
MATNSKKPLAIYLKDTNPIHHKYVKQLHKINNKGEILDILHEGDKGGDLALYFLGNENISYRQKLGEDRLLHLIKSIPAKIYLAPHRNMTLGEYAVQQCLLAKMEPAEFLPDSCWLALAEKGSTQFEEIIQNEADPFHVPHSKIVNHLQYLSSKKLKSGLEDLLSGDYGEPKNSGILK